MFANFIYFIVVLLIYATYRPADEPNFAPVQTLLYFVALTLGYVALTWIQFRRIENRIEQHPVSQNGHTFNALLTRQIVTAIFLFAIDIYGLNLPFFSSQFKLFQVIPTLEAVLYLLVFMGYLALAWAIAHRLYCRIYHSGIKRSAYIISNLMFSVPVLLPWLFLSLVSDLVIALPFQLPRQILSTTQGEIAYFLLFLVFIAIIGPAIIQKFWGCKPLPAGLHRMQIEALCRRAGLQYNNILMWPIFEGRMITAGVMGLIRRFRYILVTRALLQRLNPFEIEAVIAHEIGHVKKRHLLFYLIFFVGYMLVSYAMSDLVIYATVYLNPFITWLYRMGIDQATVLPALFSAVFILAFLLYFRYVFGYFMRNFERQADIFVFDLLGTAAPLITTLEKIAITSGEPADKPNWHHFSIRERVDYLKRCAVDRLWITRHHAKVRRDILCYLACIILLGGLGYQLSSGETGRKIDSHFYEKFLLQEIEKTPGSADLYTMLGDLHYKRGSLEEARQAYEKALDLSEDHARALNNLAWLYATAGETALKHPVRALQLARKAASLEQAPHVFDTLAESYFANGLYADAIRAEQQALALAGTGTSYYKEQLRRFEAAASQ